MSTIVSVGLVGVSIQTSVVPSGHVARERLEVGEVGDAVHSMPAGPSTCRHEAERAAVRVVGMITRSPGVEQPQHRVLGGHAAGEREAVRRAFERREALLVRGAGWGCRCAAYSKPECLPTSSLHERRRQRDRRDDRAGRRVGGLAVVDRASRSRLSWKGVRSWAGLRGARSARNASTSERVSTPTGWPPSSTSTAVHCSSRSTTSRHRLADRRASAARAPSPRRRGGRAHAGSWNALSMSGSSDTAPDTSFAASGRSVVVATTSCDTPSSRMRRERVARRAFGGDRRRGRGSRRPWPRARRPPSVPSPAQEAVARSSSGRRRSSRGSCGRSREAARRRPRRARARRPTTSAACTAVPHDPPMSSPSSRVTRRAAANDSASVTFTMRSTSDGSNVVGQKSSPTPSTRYGRPDAAREHRALGVGADDLHVGVLRLEVARHAGDGAAGADAGDEVRDPAFGLAPDLGPGGPLVLGRVGGVGVLVGPERARRLAREPVGDRVVGRRGPRAAPRWGTPPRRRRRRAAARPSPRSSCRTSRRCSGSRAARRRWRARHRCCPRWARRSCRPGWSRPSRSAASIIATAGRSFTLPPGLTISTLARRSHSRSRADATEPHERRVADQVEQRVRHVHRHRFRRYRPCSATSSVWTSFSSGVCSGLSAVSAGAGRATGAACGTPPRG